MLTLAAAVPAPAAAGDPSEHLIVGLALLRMVERLDFLGNASFGPSVVHPRPEGRYWAVVGQVLSATTTRVSEFQGQVSASFRVRSCILQDGGAESDSLTG